MNTRIASDNRTEEFAAKISHDLRTPLTTITILVDLLRVRLGTGDADVVADLDSLSQAVGDLTKLINGLVEQSQHIGTSAEDGSQP